MVYHWNSQEVSSASLCSSSVQSHQIMLDTQGGHWVVDAHGTKLHQIVVDEGVVDYGIVHADATTFVGGMAQNSFY